jgi:hypothetical protein
MAAELEDDAVDFAADLERFAEDEFIQQALGDGVDLQGYSKQIEQELRQVEAASVGDYVDQSAEVADLHGQMQSCDAILSKMQEALLGFQVKIYRTPPPEPVTRHREIVRLSCLRRISELRLVYSVPPLLW